MIELVNTETNGDKRRQRILLIAVTLSIVLHLIFFWLLQRGDLFKIRSVKSNNEPPQELTFTFPENKQQPKQRPREVVQNMNENEITPKQSNLLSDRNSEARNPDKSAAEGASPKSSGNVKSNNLSNPMVRKRAFTPAHRFSSKALTGESSRKSLEENERESQKQTSPQSEATMGSNQMMNQQKFSVEEVGALTLSTYKWNWAPYINALKNKLSYVWAAPAAYYQLGLIHGYSIIAFEIDRDGNLLKMKTLKHVGHSSLKVSSEEAIRALFKFKPLPENFPDKTLTITAKLIYPNLRNGR
jgi:outer membrane biosynthesis protein TonB